MFLLELEKEVEKQTLLRNHEVVMAVVEDIKNFAGNIKFKKECKNDFDVWQLPNEIAMFLAKETYHGVDLHLKRMGFIPINNQAIWYVIEMDDCILVKSPNNVINRDFRKIMEKASRHFNIA